MEQPLGYPGSFKPSQAFEALAKTPPAHACWFALSQGPGLLALRRATEAGQPALSWAEPLLAQLVGASWWNDSTRELVAQMVRQIMEGHGFRLIQENQKIDGYLFSEGDCYEGSVRHFP